MKTILLSLAALTFGIASATAVRETALPSSPLPAQPLPVQDEPIAPVYRENPYSESVPVPAFTEAEKRSGMMLFRRPLTEPVYPQSRPKPWERVASLNAFGARGQIVTLNFAVYPERPLQKLRATADFPLPDGQIRQLAYWKVRYPYYQTKDTYRRVPTYLFPATWCDAPALEPQQYVLNMKIPADAKPGLYRGKVTVSHAGYGKALELPFTVKVLPFELKRDPAKNFSAYFTPVRTLGHSVYRRHKDDEKWAREASLKEYKLMVDYGFTRPPHFNLSYDAKNGGRFYVSNLEKHLEEMREAKLPLPVMLLCGTFAGPIFREFTGKNLGNHVAVSGPLPEEMFQKIDRLARSFKKDWDARQLPPIIIGPIDEPSPESVPFVKRLYKIFKEAGYRTFMTSCPYPAEVDDVVDFWSDQPFRSFSEVKAGAKKEYWCYPNHNAYEIKDVATMTRGGRMTYGFGLWKSNYNFLMPWIWRYYFNEHLLTSRTGGGGHLLTDDGEIIIEYDWENFREGIIDGQYIYTLQQAIAERTPTQNRRLGRLLEKGNALLQEIWDSIPPLQKYLADGHWNDREFDGRRAELAQMIQAITAFPATVRTIAPPILVNTEKTGGENAFNALLERERKKGNLISYDIPLDRFLACEKEAQVKVEGDTLHLQIDVDQKTDGTGNKAGKYPCGWPRVRGNFKDPHLDFNRYGFFHFKMKVDSNRDGQQAIHWPMDMDIHSAKSKNAARGIALPARQEPGVWHEFLFPTSELLKHYNIDRKAGDAVDMLQFFIREGAYAHGDKLNFRFKDMKLFGVRNPVIKAVTVTPTLELPATVLPWKIELLGNPAPGAGLSLSLFDSKRRKVAGQTIAAESITDEALRLPRLSPGGYLLKAELRNSDGITLSTAERKINLLELQP